MALLKVVGNKKKIEKCLKACKSFNPVVLDKTKLSVVIQITALRREIDKMSKKLKGKTKLIFYQIKFWFLMVKNKVYIFHVRHYFKKIKIPI